MARGHRRHEGRLGWYYSGYTKVGTYSVSQNCYGYAFGTGTFVNDGSYGAEIIRSDDWEAAEPPDAAVAYKYGHTIKVTSGPCSIQEMIVYKLKSSSEKFRCSAIYEQTGECPDGVTLKNGPYSYYKKKT